MMNHKEINNDQPLIGKWTCLYLQAAKTLMTGCSASGKTMPFAVAMQALLRADPDGVFKLFDPHSELVSRIKGDADAD